MPRKSTIKFYPGQRITVSGSLTRGDWKGIRIRSEATVREVHKASLLVTIDKVELDSHVTTFIPYNIAHAIEVQHAH